MRTQDVKEVTVIALRGKVVINFISSFWGRGNFCQSRHFVRVCVCMCVHECVSACPQQLNAQRLCVWSLLGQLSTFQKDWSPTARKKWSEDRISCLWSGWAS